MNFFEKIYSAVIKIPRGRVASYSQIAALAGSPRAARLVGIALSRLGDKTKIPWHRVVNAAGMISIENLSVPKQEQARRLQAEGIKVKLKNGNYWVPKERFWR